MPSRLVIRLSLVTAGMLAILVAANRSYGAGADTQDFALIAKGHYLARAADCVACHTIPNGGGEPYAGGRAIETPFGDVTSPNITPDVDTGIGAWTDDQFDDAVRRGIGRDGARLYPAMPYTSYTKMSRDDVLAIRAYLKTIAPVHHAVNADTLPFPFSIRASMRVWDALFFTAGEFKPDPEKSATWNRGAYLVQGPGHCAACHTPKSWLGADKDKEQFRGATLQGWFAPNITNDGRTGLGRWSQQDIVDYLKNGHNRITGATGPMSEEIVHSSSQMADADLAAIATYLKSLSLPADNDTPAAPDHSVMAAGEAIYRDRCSACHGFDGKGVANLFPSLADSSMVRSADATTLLRIILRGARSVATPDEPTAPGMPSFAWQLDDDQVAAVVTYIRNAWKPAAAASSPADVHSARAELRSRTE
jgi:mono/diheme cytochrome c family protein